MDKRDKHYLREIYVKYGEDAAFNPKKLRAYLLDMCVSKRIVNLLADISRIDYFKQFAAEIKGDVTAREKLIYNTQNEYAFDERAVEYGVDCWVYALTGAGGVTSEGAQRSPEEKDGDIWPDETAELVAAALRELMKSDN